ncbi:related to ATP-dependent DNA helicase SRS2 [Zygosaccharomyces bailii]|nr:related to ATP-dependent DNA helicase SRS2 [Zygosaccharomyces bailii]
MTEEPNLAEIISSLNIQQKMAVQFDPSKALQVIAGPGTGKTKVLTSRVAYLMLHHRVKPQDILVTTFTNKAAKEMVDRLVHMLQGTNLRVSDIMIGTFHSVCFKILSRFGHKIGLKKDWRIIDEKEVDLIVNDMIERMPDQIRDYAHSITRKVNLCLPKKGGDEWKVHPKLVKKQISKLKAYAILPEEYNRESNHDPALAYLYERYQGELNKVNALDFDDLLMYTFRLLTRERCLPYVQHVFVDEFQDTNGIQMDLMFLFAKGNHHLSRGITVVGDPDQSIYAFRHALAYNFQTMVSKCPIECSRVVLVENYRSSQKILNTSETLIKQQVRGRTDRLPLRAQFDCMFAPVYLNFPASFLESPSIAKEIVYLRSLPNLFSYNDFAILVRQRRQIKKIETALIEHRIPYKILRGHAFWELKETISMINLLKCVYSDNEKNAMVATLLYPSRGLGLTSAERIKICLESSQGSAFNTLRLIRDCRMKIDIPEKARAVLKDFVSMIETCKKLCESPITSALSDVFDKLYELSGMKHEYLYNDGKKKSEIDPTNDPNYQNPRHKNILILKNYFLGSELSEISKNNNSGKNINTISNNIDVDNINKKNNNDNKHNNNNNNYDDHDYDDNNNDKNCKNNSNIETTSVGSHNDLNNSESNVRAVFEHLRNFFLSLMLYSNNTDESDQAASLREKQEKEGFVTVSTIHGAKGLEWPVVFIPGCEEGVIPSIFGDDKSQSAEDEDGDDCDGDIKEVEADNLSPKKSKLTEPDDSINEERRMFFVAQTRAKHLLYLSSVNDPDARLPSKPSRFLTPTLLNTMVDSQKALESVLNIRTLYDNTGKLYSGLNEHFSLDQLVKDYAKFIENRRERFVWGGSVVRDMYQIDIKQNSAAGNPTSEFTTAAVQLHNWLSSPEKKYAPVVRRPLQGSPSRRNAPNSSTRTPPGSPNKKREFAPNYRPSRNAPNTLTTSRRLFAPGNDRTASVRENSSPAPSEIQSSGQPTNAATTVGSKSSQHGRILNVKAEMQRVPKLKPKTRNLRGSNRKLVVAAPIDISERDVKIDVKSEEYERRSLFHIEEDPENTTAAELLHNPEDLVVDDRPIIANAKTLADAARGCRKAHSSQKEKTEVKRESVSSQLDIFSQISKAKKKAKMNDGEIIVID